MGEPMYQVGSKVVYPAHGIGIIEAIEEKEIAGSLETFYIVRILESEMTIMIPQQKAKKVGMREVISKKGVSKVIKVLQESPSDQEKTQEENWNRRYRDYIEKIKTGSVYEVAEVYRKLFFLKMQKELSFGEKQVFDNAHQLIVSEIALAKGIAEAKAEQLIIKAFPTTTVTTV